MRGVRALFDEQVEEVGLAVHGAHHARLGQTLGGLGAVVQPLDPAKRLAHLARLGALGRLAGLIALRGRGRVEPGPQHPQRDPVGIERKGRVQVQAAGQRAGLVDEGLQQPGPIAVEAFEVFAHRTHRPAQHVGGQVAAGNVGANQHPAQPHHPVQVGASARIIPTNPGVAGLEPARRGREPHAAQPAVGGADEITQLMADKGTGAARMLVCHQGVC